MLVFFHVFYNQQKNRLSRFLCWISKAISRILYRLAATVIIYLGQILLFGSGELLLTDKNYEIPFCFVLALQ